MGGRGASSGIISGASLDRAAKLRLTSSQVPGEYFNEDHTPLEEVIKEYTAGGVAFSPQEMDLIESLYSSSTNELFRVQSGEFLPQNLSVGDSLDFTVSSFSKNSRFIPESIIDITDAGYSSPVVIRTRGNVRSLNIQGYSSPRQAALQAESLTSGSFVVTRMKTVNSSVGKYTEVTVSQITSKRKPTATIGSAYNRG